MTFRGFLAPPQLAVELAEQVAMTLIRFLQEPKFQLFIPRGRTLSLIAAPT